MERLRWNFELKIHRPGDEMQDLLIKPGIIFGLGSLFGLLIGRWHGGLIYKEKSEKRAGNVKAIGVTILAVDLSALTRGQKLF